MAARRTIAATATNSNTARPALTLVQGSARVCAATVEATRLLYEGAREGMIHGLIIGSMSDGGAYFADSVGSLRENLLLARGVLATLEDCLRRQHDEDRGL